MTPPQFRDRLMAFLATHPGHVTQPDAVEAFIDSVIEPPAPIVFRPWEVNGTRRGFYVPQVRFPSGGIGCVTNDTADGKWRIVSAPKGLEPGNPGYASFDTAAQAVHAEHALALAAWRWQIATPQEREEQGLAQSGFIGMYWADTRTHAQWAAVFRQELVPKILAAMEPFGWGRTDGGAAIACMDVETEVGEKTAHVLAASWRDSTALTLQGEYLSEGRNVLEANWCSIEPTDSDATIAQKVGAWCEKAQQSIDQSYARRLHLRQRG